MCQLYSCTMFSLLRTVGLLMVSLAILKAAPPPAPNCRSGGGPHFGGSEPPLMIDPKCTDPDYNEGTFVIDSTRQHDLKLPDGTTIPYTEVKGHFPATRTQAQFAPGVLESPT